VPQNDYQPGPLAAVERISAQGRWVLIFTRELAHPINRVWEAITEPGQLRHWAPYTADRDLASTGDAVLTMLGTDGAGDGSELPGTVLQCDPPRLLVHTWGGDVLRWELVSTDDGTTLSLRQTFDDEAMASGLAAGWHLCLDVADAMMKDVPIGPIRGNQALEYGWGELNQQYAQLLDVKPTQLGEG
jgi:uncharacterized protein YndB with AHSA1/START domain